MTFFTTMLYVLVASLAIGLIVSIIIFVPLTIYVIPFSLWVGFQNNKGKYRDLKSGIFSDARNATELYKSWIIHKDPVFK